ncbi:MAG TPA: adenine phosphoribosyltransferase [Propionibacteriaceae bacterium]
MAIDLADLIADVPDFPRPGIGFKDITPLLASPGGLAAATEGLVRLSPEDVDVVVGLEARGFIFGAPVALALGVGFVPVRKPGKLPRAYVETTFDLEYGQDTIAIHADALTPGDRVLIVDDVLATGGTAVAAAELVEKLGGEVVGICVVAELAFLNGRDRLRSAGHDVSALIRFETG